MIRLKIASALPSVPGATLRARFVDPAGRRQLIRLTGMVTRTGVAMLFVSLVLAAGAFLVSTLYGQYGAPRTHASTVAWIERPATYARTSCRACHGSEAATESAGAHASLICETCHVPTVAHPGSVAGVVQPLPAAASAECATCHGGAAGRPVSFPQVALARHYPGAECLRCHDPHTAAAVPPPVVPHPLTNLPPCVTCHAPGGLKRFPAGHLPAVDGVCLTCHRPGVAES
jgi:hypothetical protein